jgi:hypothetical protein
MQHLLAVYSQQSVAGPPAVVKGLHEMLSKAGVNDGDIHAEEFAGY